MAKIWPNVDGKRVKNLGWLLRHARSVRNITLIKLPQTEDGDEGLMIATLDDDRVYTTGWASWELMTEFIKRPSLRHADTEFKL